MSLSDSHSNVVVAAFGVSVASGVPEEDFTREAQRLYELIHQCERTGRKLVFFSSASPAMYAVPGQAGTEDGPVFPSTAYGRHNLALEAVLSASSINYIVLRLAHVVGPGQPAHLLIPALINQVRSGEVRLYRGARRDLIDIDDVILALDLLLARGVNRTVVNVASGTAVPIESIVEHIEQILGRTAKRHYASDAVSQSVSTTKLQGLIPELVRIGTGDYYRETLDKYVPLYAGTASSELSALKQAVR